MTNKKDNDKKMLTPREVELAKEDIANYENIINASGDFREGDLAPVILDDLAMDRGKIVKTITALKKQLDESTPIRVADPIQRDRLARERKDLETKFVPYLETFRDLGVMKRDDMNWHQAYQKALDRRQVEHLITRWRRIGLSLEPEDPQINSLDKLRKAC